MRLRSRGILPDAREVLQLPLAKRISLSYPPPVHKSGSGALMAPPPDLQTGGLLGVYQGLILETFRRTCLRCPEWQRQTGTQRQHEGDNCRFNALKPKRRSWILVFSRKERIVRKAYRDGGVLQDFQDHPLF